MNKPVWRTEKRKVNDLIPYGNNPRKLSDKQKEDLTKSLEKFDLVEIPAINTNHKIIAGHQRMAIMQLLGRGEEIIDVRIPDRELTEEEYKEYLVRSNKNTADWDFEILEEFFDKEELIDWGFEEEELGINMNPDDFKDDFNLPDGDKSPFQQMTFTFADEQANLIKQAITDIKKTDAYKYCETFGNENSNGNALYYIISRMKNE